MNSETFVKRAQALYTKRKKISIRYLWILSSLVTGGTTFHPFRWYNSGTNFSDKTQYVLNVLEALKLSYVRGNDAPRGGCEGRYIALTPNAKRALRGAVNGLFIYNRKVYCYDGELPPETPVSRSLAFDVLRYKEYVKKVMGDAKVLTFSEVKEKAGEFHAYKIECALKVRALQRR